MFAFTIKPMYPLSTQYYYSTGRYLLVNVLIKILLNKLYLNLNSLDDCTKIYCGFKGLVIRLRQGVPMHLISPQPLSPA